MFLPLAARARRGARDVAEARSLLAAAFRSHELTLETGWNPDEAARSGTRGAPASCNALARTAGPGDGDEAQGLRAFHLAQATLDGLPIIALRYGAYARVRVPPLRDFHLLQWTLAGEAEIETAEARVALPPGSVFVMNPDAGYRKTWSPDCLQLMARIDEAQLPALRDGRALRFAPAPAPDSAMLRRLRETLRAVAEDLDADTGLAAAPLAAATRALLLKLVVEAVPNEAREELAAAAAPPWLAAAQDHVRRRCRGPLGPQEVAQAAGVGQRALQKGFQRFLGVTPVAYIRSVRLDLARRALSDPEGAADRTVTDVALASGFNHLAKFARDYAARFGERPSDALRRARRARPWPQNEKLPPGGRTRTGVQGAGAAEGSRGDRRTGR